MFIFLSFTICCSDKESRGILFNHTSYLANSKTFLFGTIKVTGMKFFWIVTAFCFLILFYPSSCLSQNSSGPCGWHFEEKWVPNKIPSLNSFVAPLKILGTVASKMVIKSPISSVIPTNKYFSTKFLLACSKAHLFPGDLDRNRTVKWMNSKFNSHWTTQLPAVQLKNRP